MKKRETNRLIRHRFVLLFIFLLLLSSLACNAVGDDGNSGGGLLLPTVPVTAVSTTPPIAIAATSTLIGGQTAVSTTPRATPFVDDGSPRMTVYGDLNIRGGPGIDYPRKTFLLAGESAIILGKHSATEWWKIECPPRAVKKNILTNCWISGKPRYSSAIHIENVPEVPAP